MKTAAEIGAYCCSCHPAGNLLVVMTPFLLCRQCVADPYRINVLQVLERLLDLHRNTSISDGVFRVCVEHIYELRKTCDVNPAPVIIGLIFTELGLDGGKVLLVQRAIPPRVGGWALVSGYIIDTLNWRCNLRKEALEEASVVLTGREDHMVPFSFATNEPRTNLILNFAIVFPAGVEAILPFTPDHETLARQEFVFTRDVRPVFCFPIHQQMFDEFCARQFGW